MKSLAAKTGPLALRAAEAAEPQTRAQLGSAFSPSMMMTLKVVLSLEDPS